MPESKKRPAKKVAGVPTPPAAARRRPKRSPTWYVALMGAVFAIGVLYLLVYYFTQGRGPLPIDALNLLVGFTIIVVGFIMATQWR